MLYLVATPIGNLQDISFRALETLKSVSLILCEDTRHSGRLLRHYEVATPTLSYHMFNEAQREGEIIERLKNDEDIALISDAGTPGISDPGERLVRACHEAAISVTSIPGPCALIQALVCSGFPTNRFQFVGFLPKKRGERQKVLEDALGFAGTTSAYESPHRLVSTLEIIQELDASRVVAVGRELTKRYEEIIRGTAAKLLDRWKDEAPKGEIVLLISQGDPSLSPQWWEGLSPVEHVQRLMTEDPNLSQSDAIKKAAKERGVPKRDVYNAVHQ